MQQLKGNKDTDGKKIALCKYWKHQGRYIQNDGGIGLFRSEFLYSRKIIQLEEEHRVIIRTLDIGADSVLILWSMKKILHLAIVRIRDRQRCI